MKKLTKYCAVILTVTLLLGACSRNGVHMSKHRKSRKCNCPTFAESTPDASFVTPVPSTTPAAILLSQPQVRLLAYQQ